MTAGTDYSRRYNEKLERRMKEAFAMKSPARARSITYGARTETDFQNALVVAQEAGFKVARLEDAYEITLG